MRQRPLALVSIATLAAIVSALLYALHGPGHRWSDFLLWKFISSKAHGGQCFNRDEGCIYYETYGAGPPVLVLHGGLDFIDGMSSQIRALANSHFVIAPDSRGHGKSTDSDTPLSYSLMSDDMLKLLNHLEIDTVDVVGWSDGGIIGLDLAMRHPERIRKLVAISANYDVDGLVEPPILTAETPRAPFRYWLFARDSTHWPLLYRKVVSMWQTQPHYTSDDLSHIRASTLIMAGEFDMVKREHTNQLAKAIPASRKITIEGATHSVPGQKPELVNSFILKFLDEKN
jgi:pimeloyl-ACP methyl ester carboxylesterase